MKSRHLFLIVDADEWMASLCQFGENSGVAHHTSILEYKD